MPTRTFILRDTIIASDSAQPFVVHAQHTCGFSLAYVCPECGDIWARIHIENTQWQALMVPCEQHPFSASWCTGMFNSLYSQSEQANAPRAILIHDFLQATKDLAL